jgi:hypothetical protein
MIDRYLTTFNYRFLSQGSLARGPLGTAQPASYKFRTIALSIPNLRLILLSFMTLRQYPHHAADDVNNNVNVISYYCIMPVPVVAILRASMVLAHMREGFGWKDRR